MRVLSFLVKYEKDNIYNDCRRNHMTNKLFDFIKKVRRNLYFGNISFKNIKIYIISN